MKGNMGQMLRQVQAMQQKMAKIQEELANRTAEGQAGGGMVTAVVNGKQQLLAVKIEKTVVDPNDVDMLQDLIVAAVNQAMTNIQATINEEMGKVTGGLKIPGLTF